jgi:nucleoside-diphosphate-sugar epimerase
VSTERTAFVTGGSGFIGQALVRRLASEGWNVRALARSDSSAAKVAEAGAEAVRGDLDNVESMRAGSEGCEVAFHSAAKLGGWGERDEFVRGNVAGTVNALVACGAAGVRRFVHVGTEAALLAGEPLVNADETWPLRPDSPTHYPATKAMAEQRVRRAAGNGFETVVIRPRLVWGPGDTTLMPIMVQTMDSGRFAWIGGGHHLTSTTHVDNVVEGLMLGAERGCSGEAYFVTDGEPVEFRDFVTRLVATSGVEAPGNEVPTALAGAAAVVAEALWSALPLPGEPPVTRLAVWLSSQECTLDISKARRELGYQPVITREDGLAALSSPSQS